MSISSTQAVISVPLAAQFSKWLHQAASRDGRGSDFTPEETAFFKDRADAFLEGKEVELARQLSSGSSSDEVHSEYSNIKKLRQIIRESNPAQLKSCLFQIRRLPGDLNEEARTRWRGIVGATNYDPFLSSLLPADSEASKGRDLSAYVYIGRTVINATAEIKIDIRIL